MQPEPMPTTYQTPQPKQAATAGESFRHEPVLLSEVLSLAPASAGLLVDATLGGGGHAEALLKKFPAAELFGCDRDPNAVEAAGARLSPFAGRILLKQTTFSDLRRHLVAGSVDFMLADIGLSSPQIDVAERGFSFTREGPLDMRMDPTAPGPNAADLVNKAKPERLVEILRDYGEERFAQRIVRAIIRAREKEPVATTAGLAGLIAGAVPARFHRKGHHPATKSFQALRMAVNDELGQLEAFLERAPGLLAPGGRLAVISFHSLEDRMVKTSLRGWESPCQCPPEMPKCICGKLSMGSRLTKKPITTSREESARNPRSRGAKLRGFEKR